MTEKKSKKVYGRTKSGVEITDELIEKWVAEAEAGYDLTKARWRVAPGGARTPTTSFPVRLDPALRFALKARASQDHKPAAEIVREALRRYLAAS